MKVGDLVRLRNYLYSKRTACGTIIHIDEEDYVTVQWWDKTVLIPNPSIEKPTDLIIVCEGGK